MINPQTDTDVLATVFDGEHGGYATQKTAVTVCPSRADNPGAQLEDIQ